METLMPIWNGGIGGFPVRKALSQQVIVRAQAV
jgi:hypothetical protein